MGAFIEIGDQVSTFNVANSDSSINLAQNKIINVTNGNGIVQTSAFNSDDFNIDGEIHVTNGSAMRITGMDNKLTIDFDAIITANIGIWLDNGSASPSLDGNSVVVKGQVVATGDGIRNEAHDTTILNLDRIEGDTGIVGTTFGVDITNDDFGSIKGNGTGIDLSAIDDISETSKIVNDGTITGTIGIIGGDEKEIVTNHGTINGGVDLGDGADVFDARKGTVSGAIEGGDGNDTYIVDKAGTNIVEQSTGGTADSVESTVSFSLGANFENLFLLGKARINGTGNSEDNNIHGNDGANTLKGLGGNDLLFGGKGNDGLVGGAGIDHFTFQTGFDHDTLADFHAGGANHDVIDLADVGSIASFTDLINHHAEASHGDVIIDAGHGDTITLNDVSLKSLHASDFAF